MTKELNEELLKRADQIMNAVAETAQKAGTFAMEQLPDIAQQFITYGRVTSTIYVTLGITLVLGAIIAAFNERIRDDVGPLLAVPVMVGGVIALSNFNTMIMSWFAPKLYLITQIAQLLK